MQKNRSLDRAENVGNGMAMRLKNSFWALIGKNLPEPVESVAENIRETMLNTLDHACGGDHSYLRRRINFSPNVDSLWYLRSDLMASLCDCHDEGTARRALTEVTELFKGHHPSAINSKFGSL